MDTITQANPATVRDACDLLKLFSSENHPYHRGNDACREKARTDLAAAIASQDAAELSDAMHEARYRLGLFCTVCMEPLEDDENIDAGYCSLYCCQRDNADGDA